MHPSILLCIISHEEGGGVSPFTALNMARIGSPADLSIHITVKPYDLVRTRSLMAELAWEQNRTHLLFWDSDVSVADPVVTINQMVAIGENVVFTMYPRKRLEERTWPILRMQNPRQKANALEIAACGMGLTLITRECIEIMREHSKPFKHVSDGVERRPRAIFMLEHIGEELLSEDFSFCHRWRNLGGSVWLNRAGVADHWGCHLYEGMK